MQLSNSVRYSFSRQSETLLGWDEFESFFTEFGLKYPTWLLAKTTILFQKNNNREKQLENEYKTKNKTVEMMY